MKAPDTIRKRLETRCEAKNSSKEVKNNKYHYHLEFTESIGWDWIQGQIGKMASDEDIRLELWEINPLIGGGFDIEVRELVRREGINDDNQHSLTKFES